MTTDYVVDGLKFLRSSLKKLLATGFITLLLGLFALYEGVGYETINVSGKTTSILSSGCDVRMGPYDANVVMVLHEYSANVSLSPFFYPISYLLGNGNSSNIYRKLDDPLLPDRGHGMVDNAKFGAVFPEFLRNLPYLFLIGFLTELLIEKLYRKVQSQA